MIRESITSALKEDGEVYKYDVSLPLPQLYELVSQNRVANMLYASIGVIYRRVLVKVIYRRVLVKVLR